jgi:hypothetical protein
MRIAEVAPATLPGRRPGGSARWAPRRCALRAVRHVSGGLRRSTVVLNPPRARGHEYESRWTRMGGRGPTRVGAQAPGKRRRCTHAGRTLGDRRSPSRGWTEGGRRRGSAEERHTGDGWRGSGAEAGRGGGREQGAMRVGAWVRLATPGQPVVTEACRQGDAGAYPERRVDSLLGVEETPLRTGVGVSIWVLGVRRTGFAIRSCENMGAES